MSKYFKSVKSYKELKDTYKALLKVNHPDNGGNLEVMQEINAEYDALFKIWKDRYESETGEKVAETAQSTRKKFYTEYGWEGSRYDSKLSLKEIAQIVRAYVKEKYPTCKFSVRTKYASMCQELFVDIKEFPAQMYKTADDLRKEGIRESVTTTIDWGEKKGETYTYWKYTDEVDEMLKKISRNGLFEKNSWDDEELLEAYENARQKSTFYAIKTEYFKSVIDDVTAFVKSYNYEDCDGMVDYFDVNFWFFGVKCDDCKQVEKVARVKTTKTDVPATTTESTDIVKSEDVKVELNDEFNGVEISFKTKPNNSVINELKKFGFRWHSVKRLWYAKQTDERIKFAQSIA